MQFQNNILVFLQDLTVYLNVPFNSERMAWLWSYLFIDPHKPKNCLLEVIKGADPKYHSGFSVKYPKDLSWLVEGSYTKYDNDIWFSSGFLSTNNEMV